MALLSSPMKPLITQAQASLTLLWVRLFMSSSHFVPPGVGFIALSKPHASCLCHPSIKVSHLEGCAMCMPPVCPLPRPGEELLVPGSLSRKHLSLTHGATPVPVGRPHWGHEMCRTVQSLVSLWSAFLVHFIPGFEMPGKTVYFHWYFPWI